MPDIRPRQSVSLAPRTSRMARLRRRGARLAPSLCTLGRLAGRPWCPPSLLRQVLRVRQGKAAHAARVSDWPTAAPLVRNSPRGWTPRSLTTIRWSWEESRWRGGVVGPDRCRNTRAMQKRSLVRGGGYPVVERLPRVCTGAGMPACLLTKRLRFGSTYANLSVRESLRCPPSRRVPHKWSGRRPNRNTGRAAAVLFERGGLSEQRGWAPKALHRDVRRLRLSATTAWATSTLPQWVCRIVTARAHLPTTPAP